jgi:hypothetical protein
LTPYRLLFIVLLQIILAAKATGLARMLAREFVLMQYVLWSWCTYVVFWPLSDFMLVLIRPNAAAGGVLTLT